MGALDRIRRQELDELRELSAADIEMYGLRFAEQLLASSRRLTAAGESFEALGYVQEAVEILRTLRPRDDKYLFSLAPALVVLGMCLNDVNAVDRAVVALEESIAAATDMLQHSEWTVPALALRSAALEQLSLVLGNTGRTAEAIAFSRQAIDGYRQAHRAEPAVSAELARALHNAATLLASSEQTTEAIELLKEALSLYDDLSFETAAAKAPERSRTRQLYTLLTAPSDADGTVSGEALHTYEHSVEAAPYSVAGGLGNMGMHAELVPPAVPSSEQDSTAPDEAEERKNMGIARNSNVIDLAEAIRAVRADLESAIAASGGDALRLRMDGIELEFTIELRRDPSGTAGVRTLVVLDGATSPVRATETHRLKLTLSPMQVGSVTIGVDA